MKAVESDPRPPRGMTLARCRAKWDRRTAAALKAKWLLAKPVLVRCLFTNALSALRVLL